MLVLFDKSLSDKADELIKSKLSKEPFALYLSLSESDFESKNLDELLSSQALFKRNYIIKINLEKNKNTQEKLAKHAPDFAKSEHLFLFLLEDKLLDEFEIKYSEFKNIKIIKSKHRNIEKKDNFEIFKLHDYILQGKAKEAWMFYNYLVGNYDINQIYASLYTLLDKLQDKDRKVPAFKAKLYENFASKKDKSLKKDQDLFLRLPSKARALNIKLELLLESWILRFLK